MHIVWPWVYSVALGMKPKWAGSIAKRQGNVKRTRCSRAGGDGEFAECPVHTAAFVADDDPECGSVSG